MITRIIGVALGVVLLSGCSVKLPIAGSALSTGGGSLWQSSDGGATFVAKVAIDEKQKIPAVDVVSLVFHPTDHRVMYMGTVSGGLFKTVDGAEHWERMNFPPVKNYGLAISSMNGDEVYASGILSGTGKIYQSQDAGKNWKELYTEPGQGTVITALASHPDYPDTLYAGTSAGVIIKSVDGGKTWKNLTAAKGPVTKILFQRGSPDKVTILVFEKEVIVSSDGGKTWDSDTAQNFRPSASRSSGSSTSSIQTNPNGIVSIAGDTKQSGILYAGAKNGLFRSVDNGKTWVALNIIESSKKFPIRSVAINPKNPSEVVYASGGAFYKSLDGGVRWATTQLEIDRGVSVIEYDPQDTGVIYFGLKKF